MPKQQFITAAIAAARASSAHSGLPAGVTAAQAALESAWGNSRLAVEAKNYFGIKYHPESGGNTNDDQGNFIELPTLEAHDGVLVKTTARFARYASMAACFAARDHIILTLPCYAEARACCGRSEDAAAAFIAALAKHWATDPQYAAKLTVIYHQNGFADVDRAKDWSTTQLPNNSISH